MSMQAPVADRRAAYSIPEDVLAEDGWVLDDPSAVAT